MADPTGASGAARPRFVDPASRFNWPVGAGFAALCVLVSYPGRLNGDTLFSLAAVRAAGAVNNWHSATLVWFWSLAAGWLGQPASGLVMQAALFGLFAGFLPRLPATFRGRVTQAGEWLLRVALAGGMGYVGKDAVIVATLLVAVQLVRRTAHERLGWIEVAALVAVTTLFLLAKAPNFLVIVVAVALTLPFLVRSPARYVALVAATLAIGALAVPLNRAVDRYVFAARDLHPDKQLVLFDLAGISVRTGQDAFRTVPGWPAARLPAVASCYLPYMWDSFAHWAPCGGYADAYDALDGPLTKAWLRQIAAHPLAYAQHRLTYVHYLLESRDHAAWGIAGQAANDASDPVAAASLRHSMAELHVHHPIASWRPTVTTGPMRWLETLLFRFAKVQWVGLIACLAVLLWSWVRQQDGVRLGAILAAALGVGNVAMLAVFGVADPARYLWPTVALAYVALLALLAPAETTRAG